MATRTLTSLETSSTTAQSYINYANSAGNDPYSRDVIQDIMELFKEMAEEVKNAKQEASKKLDPFAVVVGVGTGILSSSFGTFSAFAVGVAAAYAWQNGSAIVNTAKKVYESILEAPVLSPLPPNRDECILINKTPISRNWWKKESSHSEGNLDVNFGNEVMTFRFNLNDSEYPISKEDLLTLYTIMCRKLENKTLDPQRCKNILFQMETVSVPFDDRSSVMGLLKRKQKAYGLVRALNIHCDRLLGFKADKL